MFTLIRYASQDLLYQPGRTLLTVTGLAVIVFAYLILVGLSGAMADYGRHADVSQKLIIIQANVADLRHGFVDDDALQAALDLPEEIVQHISPLGVRTMRVNEYVLSLFSADVADWEVVYELNLVAGHWPTAAREAAVSEGAARAAGWQLGDTLRIFGADFKVTAVIRAANVIAYSSVWLDRSETEQLLGSRRDRQIVFIQLAPGSDAEAVRRLLEADERLDGRYHVYFQDNLGQRYADTLRDIRRVTRVVNGIILLTIVFSAYNGTSLTLAERGRETAILRALGFAPAFLYYFLLLRAIMLSAIAYGLGLGVAAIFLTIYQANAPLLLLGLPLSLQLTVNDILWGAALILALAAAGAWFSSRRLVWRNVADILRE